MLEIGFDRNDEMIKILEKNIAHVGE